MKRIIASAALALSIVAGIAGFSTTAASAAPQAAPSLVTAFDLNYLHKVVYPLDGGTACGRLGPTTANLEVESYDVRQTDGTISRVYDIDMDGDVRDGVTFDLVSYRVYIDGVNQGATNNFSVKFADQSKRRDIRGEWYAGPCKHSNTIYNM